MNSINVTIERSTFPLSRFFIKIGEENLSLRPGEIKNIRLLESDEYEIIASSYWLKKRVCLHLENNSVVKITNRIPDIFYLTGVPVLVIFSILIFFGIIGPNLMAIPLAIYCLPITYITFFKRSNYFKISSEL